MRARLAPSLYLCLQDVFVSPGVLHRLPSLWHRPQDFVLERWLTPATAAATATTGDARGVAAATTTNDDDDDAALTGEGLRRGPFAYMPFLAGPHACIGRKFAHLETCTALAVLLRAFSFAPVPGREVRATLQLTQRPTPSLQLIATPRS